MFHCFLCIPCNANLLLTVLMMVTSILTVHFHICNLPKCIFDGSWGSPSVLWRCWLGHVTHKIVSEMSYNVSSGTLNPTIPVVMKVPLNIDETNKQVEMLGGLVWDNLYLETVPLNARERQLHTAPPVRHGVLETWVLVSRPNFESLGLGLEH